MSMSSFPFKHSVYTGNGVFLCQTSDGKAVSIPKVLLQPVTYNNVSDIYWLCYILQKTASLFAVCRPYIWFQRRCYV